MKSKLKETKKPDYKFLPINLPEEVGKLLIIKNELKGISIRHLLKVVRRSVQYLSYQYQAKQIEIFRVALRFGIRFLYDQPGVAIIKQAKHHLLEYSLDLDNIRLFESRFFDFKSNETARFFGRFPEEDVNQCNGLADILGLNKNIIVQIAIIYTLLHDDIPAANFDQMVEILERFLNELENWAKKAGEIKSDCKKGTDIMCRKSLKDYLGL